MVNVEYISFSSEYRVVNKNFCMVIITKNANSVPYHFNNQNEKMSLKYMVFCGNI